MFKVKRLELNAVFSCVKEPLAQKDVTTTLWDTTNHLAKPFKLSEARFILMLEFSSLFQLGCV